MNHLVQQILAKILVIPSIFVFVVACCSPVAQNAIKTDVQQNNSGVISDSHVPEFQAAHHCNHEKQEQIQSTNQNISRNVFIELGFHESELNTESVSQSFSKDLGTITQNHVMGPPWDRKNIKGFLGVFRS